ncbi:MAG TPA: hypothetical protein VGE07_04270, partial [Herpetosiphonaceae bacterium]
PRWRPAAALGIGGLLALVVGSTAWSSVDLLRRDNGLYGRERLQLLELADHIPAGAPVLLSGAEELRGPTTGLIAYALRGHPLLGRTATGYQVYDALPPGATAPYAVLGAGDDPAEWGFAAPPLWSNRLAALYAAPPGRLAHLNGRAAAYERPYPQALHRNTTLELALLGSGALLTLDQPLDLALGAADLRLGAAPPGGEPATRTLVMALGAVEPAVVLLESGGISQTIALSPGLHLVASPPLAAPAVARLSSDRPVSVRWIELYDPALMEPPAAPPTLALDVSAAPTAGNPLGAARIAVRPAPTGQRLRMALEIYEDSTEINHYGWAVLPLGPADLELDLAGRSLAVNGAPVAMEWGERPAEPRRFFAALWIYQGETLIKRIPLLTFADDGAAISAIEPLDTNSAFASLPQPALPLAARFGEGAELAGATIAPAAAGRTARLSLWWRAAGPTPPLMLTAQVLGDADRKFAQWDGLLGGDGAPSQTWQPGELIRQDVPLALDPATPAGRKRLLVGVYAPDGTRLPVSAQAGDPGAGASRGDALFLEIDVPAGR